MNLSLIIDNEKIWGRTSQHNYITIVLCDQGSSKLIPIELELPAFPGPAGCSFRNIYTIPYVHYELISLLTGNAMSRNILESRFHIDDDELPHIDCIPPDPRPRRSSL